MSDMARAYDLAARAVWRRLEEQRPDCFQALRAIRQHDVSVFTGAHDHVQEVLTRLGIPFSLDGSKLGRITFANCTSGKHCLTGKIEPHVRAGGWLVSSDWCLDSVVQKNFPGTIARASKSTGDEVVDVEPDLESYWSEVVVLGTNPQWWLEGASYPIKVLDAEKVRIEAASHELLVKYDSPAVAVRFAWGKGQVFHVISHFWLKRSRTPGPRHQGPAEDFLRAGLRLSETGIERVVRESKVDLKSLNFAMIQSAATSTELIAQLCIHATRA